MPDFNLRDPTNPMTEATIALKVLYDSLVSGGFTVDQAARIIAHYMSIGVGEGNTNDG